MNDHELKSIGALKKITLAGVGLFFISISAHAGAFEQQLFQAGEMATAAARQMRQTFAAAQTPPAPVQGAEWAAISGPDGSFTAEMPAFPQYQERAEKSPAGTAYTLRSYVLFESSRSFLIQTLTEPQDVDMSNPEALLQRRVEMGARSLDGGKWTNISWKRAQDFISVEVVGNFNRRDARSYYVIKGHQRFYVVYNGPAGTAQSSDVNHFINSLVIR